VKAAQVGECNAHARALFQSNFYARSVEERATVASVGLLRETRLRYRLTRPRSFLLVCPSRGPGFQKSKFQVSFDNRVGLGLQR
jgi:hypothetical protein